MVTYNFSTKRIHNMVRPVIKAAAPFEALSYLDTISLEDTQEILAGLLEVMNGDAVNFSWGSEGCIVNSSKNDTTLIYEFDLSEVKVLTKELYQFMLDWQQYLKRMEINV